MAIGATPGSITLVFARQGAVLVGAGMILGIGASLALSRIMKGLLFGLSATDPSTYVIAIVVLAMVSGIACLLPSWRASRIDPMTALRPE